MKRDDSMFEVVEYLRDEALKTNSVGPRRYEHWEITLTSPKREGNGGKWMLFAKWMLRRDPSEPATQWLTELVQAVCKKEFEALRGKHSGYYIFQWDPDVGEDDDSQGTDKRSSSFDREVEQTPRGNNGAETDPRSVVGEVQDADETDGGE